MPLRMLIDAGAVAAHDVALVGARSLDPPEVEFIREVGIRTDPGGLPDRVYVALDCDVLTPGSLDVFMPEPGGPTLASLESLLGTVPQPAGAGLTGLVASERNAELLPRLVRALGL
jgi:arginase family enzyme